MKISRFVHVLNDTTVWHAMERKKIKLNKQLVDYIREQKGKINISEIPQKLVVEKLIVDEKEEKKYIDQLVAETTDKQFQSLYLITTTSCNLDCSYCFYRCSASNSLKNKKQMSFATAKKAIDKFYKIVDNNIKNQNYWQQVTFYGGEPLLNEKMLKLAIPYAKTIFNDNFTSLVLNTNLTLLNDEIINLLKVNHVEVQVSLDGNKKQHDINRKTIDGKGTYDIVISNIKKLIFKGIKVLPMITATDSNVHCLSDTLHFVVDELNIVDFAVNILITDSFATNKDYPAILAKEMLKAYKSLESKAADYDFVNLYNMLIGQNKFISQNNCGATRKITVFPDGQVCACQALEKLNINNMGTLDEDFLSNKNWATWRYRNRFKNNTCLDCKVVASCGGGCAAGSYNGTKSINGIDYNICEYNKNLFNILIDGF